MDQAMRFISKQAFALPALNDTAVAPEKAP